jgi:hypothetical protein
MTQPFYRRVREPANYLCELLPLCKAAGLHVALDTCGAAATERYRLRQLYAQLNDTSPVPIAALSQAKPEAGTAEALRALGYVQ